MSKDTFIFLAVTGLILRITFSYLTPAFTGNDEQAHLRYVQHILADKRLPNLNNYPTENPAGNEYFQPPLFYTLLAPLIALAQDPIHQLRIGRLFSILLWLAAFYFTYKILALIRLSGWISTSIIAFVALLPSYVVNSSVVTNDALVIPLFTITLYFILTLLNNSLTYSKLALLALLAALTVLSKLNGLIIVPIAYLLIFFHHKSFNSTLLLKALFFSSVLFTLTFWWFLFNFTTYSNLLGPIETSTATFTKIPFGLYKIFLIMRGSFATFWIAYGPANEIRLSTIVYLLLFFLTIFSLLGIWFYFKKLTMQKVNKLSEKPILILFTALITNLALLLVFNIWQHQPLGRYLFLSLIPISLIFSSGLYFILPQLFRKFVPLFLILLLLTLNIWGAVTLLKIYH